jgi:hypothetical protein
MMKAASASCSLLAALLLLVPSSGASAQPTPDQCFNPTNNTALADAVHCLSRARSGRQFFLDSNYITPASAPNYFPTLSSPYPAWTDFESMVRANKITISATSISFPSREHKMHLHVTPRQNYYHGAHLRYESHSLYGRSPRSQLALRASRVVGCWHSRDSTPALSKGYSA